MTEKDAVKFRDFSEKNWWYLLIKVYINKKHKVHIINNNKSLFQK